MLSRFFLKVFFVCLAANIAWISGISAETKNTTDAAAVPAEASAKTGETFKSVVPALIGLTLDQASTLLPQYDLSLGTVTEKSSTAKVGTITAQSSQANSEVDRWSVINVTIAVASTESQPLAAPVGAASTPATIPEPAPAEQPAASAAAPATSNANEPLIPEIPFNASNDTTNTAAKEDAAKPAENTANNNQAPAPAANTAEPTPALKIDVPPELLGNAAKDQADDKADDKATSTAAAPATPEPAEAKEAAPKAEKKPQDVLSIPADTFKVEEEKKAEDSENKVPEKSEDTAKKEEAKPESKPAEETKPADDTVKPDISAVTEEKKAEEANSEKAEPETAAASATPAPSSEEKPAEPTTDTAADTTNNTASNTASSESSEAKKAEPAASNDTETSTSNDESKTSDSEASTAEKSDDTEIKGLTTTAEKEEEKKAESKKDNKTSRPAYPQATKVSLSLSPSDVQVTRDIAMTVSVDPPLKGDVVYQFNISGKAYNSKTPEFTHVFDDEKIVIVTGSARILGKPWLHSASKRVKVGKYVARKIKVPKIVGLSESEAKALLESKGLEVGNIQDKIVKNGKGVIKQMPTAGTIRTEDDNKIHYVRAVDEKYKVRISSELPSGALEAGTSVTFKAKVRPLPRNGKVRYRFMVGDKSYYSESATWKHTFKEAGDMNVKAQAIIDGQGMFESVPTTVSVVGEWKKPTAVITPFTISVAQGEAANFESVSTYDSRGEVEMTWKNAQGDASKGTSLSVDTKGLDAGEHAVSLTVKDKRGFEHTAKAQLIITAAADTAKEDENKEDAATAQLNSDDASADGEKQAADKEANPTELALDEATKSVLEAEAAATSTEPQEPTKAETKPEATNEVAEKPEEVLTLKPEDVKAMQNAQSASTEQAADAQATATEGTASTGAAVEAQTVSDSNDTSTSWGMWLWLAMIAIVLLPILWILSKLRNKPAAQQSPSFGSPMQGSDDIIAKRTPPPVANTSKRHDPKLTDFDLDVKPAESKSKKDELTNFNLDDDK